LKLFSDDNDNNDCTAEGVGMDTSTDNIGMVHDNNISNSNRSKITTTIFSAGKRTHSKIDHHKDAIRNQSSSTTNATTISSSRKNTIDDDCTPGSDNVDSSCCRSSSSSGSDDVFQKNKYFGAGHGSSK
jgi:hypothetical protein